MKARIFIDVELDDTKLIETLGMGLPDVLARYALEQKLAEATTAFVQTLSGVKRAKAAYIPNLLGGAL